MTTTYDEPVLEDERLEIVRGRRAPFTQVADWVNTHPDLKNNSKLLYALLSMHVNSSRGDNRVWPTQKMLARLMKLKQARSIKQYLDELVAAGAIEMELVTYAGKMRRRYLYVVHETPPPGHPAPADLASWYAEEKRKDAEKKAKTAAQAEGAVERTLGEALDGTTGSAAERSPEPPRQRTPKKQDEQERDERQPASGGRRAAARGTGTRPVSPRPPTKSAQAAADRARRKEAADARSEQAREIAQVWWEHAQAAYGRWAGAQGGYMALVRMIERALKADYSVEQIRLALRRCGKHLPQAARWQEALGTAAGRSAASGAGHAGRPAAYSDADTWDRPPATDPKAPTDLTEAEAAALFAR